MCGRPEVEVEFNVEDRTMYRVAAVLLLWFALCAATGVLLAGCSTVTYTHGNTSVSSTSFALTRQIGHIEITDETGHAVVDQAKTDEVQVIQAAVEGALKGAAKAVAP